LFVCKRLKIKKQNFQICLVPIFLSPRNYYLYSGFARKKGYSEVAVFTKVKPLIIKYNLGFERFDQEGRILFLEYPNFTLINVYIPHGGRMKQNLQYKLEFYLRLVEYLREFQGKEIIIRGDFNVARRD